MTPDYMRQYQLAAKLLFVALVYFACGRLGLAIPYVGSHITLIWLPTGIAVAALLRWGYICWGGIFLGSFATNFSIDFSPLLDFSIAFGNTLAPLLTVWLLRRQKIHFALDRIYDILWLAISAAIGMLVSASGGVSSLVILKVLPMQEFGSAWLSWWAGDFLGVLLAAPLLLNISRAELKIVSAQRLELSVWFVTTFAVYCWLFYYGGNELVYSHQLSFLGLPTIVWAAMRFSVMGASLCVLLSVFLVVFSTGQGFGPFISHDTQQGLFQLWAFFFTLVFIELMVVALQSGRKQAEVALQQSEWQLRTIIETEPECVKLLANDGTVLQMNSAGLRMLEADTPGQLIGQKAQGIVAPQHRKAFVELMRRVFAGESGHLEFEVVGLKGTHRWLETYEVPLRDAQGQITSMLGVTRDITERKNYETALKESERYNRTLFESLPTGLVLCSMDGKIVDVNEAYASILGRTIEETLSLSYWDITPNKYAEQEQAQLASLNSTGSYGPYEKEYIRKDGHLVPVELSGRIIERGGERYIWSSVEDITERKQAEIVIRNSEAKLRAIIEATPVPLAMNDEHGNITYLNKAFITTVGYTLDEIHTLNDWWPRAYPDPKYRQWVADSWQNNLEEAKRTNRPFPAMELNVLCKDGVVRTFLVSASSLHDSVSGTHLVTLFDITERKRAEVNQLIAATAFESQEGLMITDADGVILRVNHAFTQSTGYTEQEVVGRTPSLLKSDRHDAEFYRAMWESIHSTGAWQGEIWDRRKNGEIYPKWLSISAVRGDGGIITHYVGSHLDITERKSAEEKIKHLAFHDHLTDLPNRLLLMDRLQQALASSARSGRIGALLFIDLDNFKNINDTLGHDMGDMLLKQVTQRLVSCIREVDTVSRLGGDEFVVMLLELSQHPIEAAAQTEAIGEKILAALSQPYRLDKNIYRCTGSIGVTLFSGKHETEELMKQADIAMYQAKKAGRNALRFFDRQMQESISARVSLEAELHNALEFQELHLHYQIQVDSSHRPLGAEALIRWIHPVRGQVSPAQFIPLAEETGLILPIGQWVLETACDQLKLWQQDALTRDLTMAVNVSAKQFHQADFVAQVQAVVERHAINPMKLKLELTESIMLENIEATITTMNALNEIGVQLSLDDFGTGYSSLQYLKQLPLDQLKIDQSFVRDISIDSSVQAIVSTIIAMAQILNLDVIAEGVEAEEQRQFLLSSGCSQFQGYLFSRPVPIEQFEASLKQS
ncbi:MAG: PAS domain S-box protein [Nitrosomonadales bacterium]|nr:PAS domain S-box protein [Nitrosomonadales bacterium]